MPIAPRIGFDPSWTIAKLLFTCVAGYSMLSTFFMGLKSIIQMAMAGASIMIFDAEFSTILLWIGLVAGVLILAFVGYWFKYQDYMQKNDVSVKFDKKYLIAGALTIIVSILLAGVALFYGTKYVMVETTIIEPGLIFLIAFIFGAVGEYLVDACIFHPIADGRAAQIFNAGQAEVRAKAEELAKSEAVFQAVKDICVQKGLTNDLAIKDIIKSGNITTESTADQIAEYVDYALFKMGKSA